MSTVPDFPTPGRYAVLAATKNAGATFTLNTWSRRRDAEENARDCLAGGRGPAGTWRLIHVFDFSNRTFIYTVTRPRKSYGKT